MALPSSVTDMEKAKFVADGSGNTCVRTSLSAGDIQLGAVELKDGTADTRGTVNAANTARTTATSVLAVQNVDATGRVTSEAMAVQAYGTDAAGANAYATVVTAGAEARHVKYNLSSSAYSAVISLDGGTTDSFVVEAGEVGVLDGVLIAAGAAVQAKNLTPDSNYTNLYISIW